MGCLYKRKIPYKDHHLTAIKWSMFQYEILLPDNYYMIYGGLEDLGPLSINGVPEEEYLLRKGFNGTVHVINMSPRYHIPYEEDPTKSETENMMNSFKKLIDDSFEIHIYMDAEYYRTIENIFISYIFSTNQETGIHSSIESLELIDEVNFGNNKGRNLCRIRYK